VNKFENVDVLAALEQIMCQNTAFYQDDFEIDKEMIRKAAASDKAEDKIAQIVYDGQRVVGGEGRSRKTAKHQHHRRVYGKNAFAFSAHRQAMGFLAVFPIQKFHFARPPCSCGK